MSLLLLFASVPAVSGTVSTANAPETSTLASTEVITGAVGSATAAETSDQTGRELFTGAVTTANAPETSTLASTEVITGSIASATVAETGSLAGAEAFVGTAATGNAPETSTLASAEVISGSVSSADAAQTASLAGTEAMRGAVASANAAETSTLASAEVITGTIATAVAANTSAITAAEAFVGGASSANAPETTTLASVEVITGSIASATVAQPGMIAGVAVVTGSIATATAPQSSLLRESDPAASLPAIAALAPGEPGAWLDSTDGLTAEAWVDRLNGLSFAAAGSPAVVSGAFNGRAAARFDGQSLYSVETSPVGANPDAFTLILLAKSTTPDDSFTREILSLVDIGGSYGSNASIGLDARVVDEAITHRVGVFVYGDGDFAYTPTDDPLTTPTLIEFYTPSHTEALRAYVNGVEQAPQFIPDDLGTLNFLQMVIGTGDPTDPVSSPYLFEGDVYVAVALPSVLSLEDRQVVYDWITDVYGLELPPLIEVESGALETAQDAQTTEMGGTVTNPDVVTPIGGGIIVRPAKRRGDHITVVSPPAVRTWVVPRARVELGPITTEPAPARRGWTVPTATMAVDGAQPTPMPAGRHWIALAPAVMTAPDPDEEFLILSLADGFV